MKNLNRVKEHYQELENIEERIKNDRRIIRHHKKSIEVLEGCLTWRVPDNVIFETSIANEVFETLIAIYKDLMAEAKSDLSEMKILKSEVKNSLIALIEEL